MKKCIPIVLLLFGAIGAVAQCPSGTPTTASLGLYTPGQNSPNWGYCLNLNFTKLDSLLSGITAIPALTITNSLNVGGNSTFNNVIINGTCTGQCGGGGGGGAVASVFGRIGVVTAQTGDYSVSQITGAFPGPGYTYIDPVLTGGGTAQLNMSGAPTATGLQLPLGGATFVAPTQVAGVAVDSVSDQAGFLDADSLFHYWANADALSTSPPSNGILVQVVQANGPPALSTVVLQGNATDIAITNPDGTAGNPTIASVATGVTAAAYTCANITINAFGKITAAANGTCSGGGGGGNTTSTALVTNNLTTGSGPNSIVDSGIGGVGGVLTFNGSTSGTITLTPSPTASTLTFGGSNTPTIVTPTGTAGSVVLGTAANTGINFLNGLSFSQGGTNVFSAGVNAVKCNGTCNWGANVFTQAQTFQSGVDTTTPSSISGVAHFRSAAVTGGGSTGSGTGSAFFGTGDNGATGGAVQSAGDAWLLAGGLIGASGALPAWTEGRSIVAQYYWADTTATANTLGCFTTPGTNGQLAKVGTCQNATAPWVGAIGTAVGQSIPLIRFGHATLLSFTSQTDTAGFYVCQDTTNFGYVVVQSTACTTTSVGRIDQTGSGGTSHSVDVVPRVADAGGGGGGGGSFSGLTGGTNTTAAMLVGTGASLGVSGTGTIASTGLSTNGTANQVWGMNSGGTAQGWFTTGSGNTTSTSLTTNTIPKANGANSIINSSISDNGTTVSTAENLSVGSAAATASLGMNTTSGNNSLTTTSGANGQTWTLPSVGGTLADRAQVPLALDATTGLLSCPTCVTTGNTIPISAGGTNATSATAGTVPNATSPTASSWTPTPTLGSTSTPGFVTMFTGTGSTGTTNWGSSIPGSATVTILGFNAVPITTDIVSCTTSGSTCTMTDSGVPSANVVRKDTSNVAFSNMTLDMSAATSSNAFRAPSNAGFTASTNGSFGYDSSAQSSHLRTNGADSIVGAFASAPVGSKCLHSVGTTGLVAETATDCGSSSGGDTITTPNSTLNVGGSPTNTTLDVVGAAGKVLAGATPALTYTPTLGISGNAGTLSMFPASGNFTTTLGSAATASNTVNFFATAPTTGHIIDVTTASTTATLHDSGLVTADEINYHTPATGIARTASGSQALVATELSGDVTTSGSNAATVVQVNGGVIPSNAPLLGTNSSSQLVAGTPFILNPKTTTYQVLTSDFTGYKTINVSSGTFTITLVAVASQPPNGTSINVLNYGSGVVTIARSGQNINGGTASIVLNAGSATAPTSAYIVSDGSNYFATVDEATLGTVTSIATTSPIAGGTITGTGTITCPTCVTASSPGVGIAHFAGSTQAVTSSAVNLASADVTGTLPITNMTQIPFDSQTNDLTTPTGDASFTFPAGASNGFLLSGTSPNSVSTSTGTNAQPLVTINGVTGGADSNATGTAGIGSNPSFTSGNGGAGTGTNTVGGAGGALSFTTGAGGASLGTGANSNGGNFVVTLGKAGTGGSGTAGVAGTLQVTGTAPSSVSTSTGLNAGTLFTLSGVTGGASSNATGTGGTGSAGTLSGGTGGAGTGTNAVGGTGGGISVTTGAGGASNGTGANSNGGNFTVTLGIAGVGGSGANGVTGQAQFTGTAPASASGNGLAVGTLFNVAGVAGGATSSTGANTGGTGSAATISGGTGGAATGVGGNTTVGGIGGAITLTGGTGGAGSAGNNSGGAGGNINLTPGAGGAKTGTGSVGAAGVVAITGAATVSSTLSVTGHVTLEGVTSTGAQGTGALVFATSPTLTTPVIGAATGTSLYATGILDGKATVNVTTTTPCTLGTASSNCSAVNSLSGYNINEHATAATAITYNLPTAAAGLQYCVANGYNGSNPNTGVLTVATSATGQFIIFTDGTITATGGNITSGGAAGDAACVVGVDATHWLLYVNRGTWTKH